MTKAVDYCINPDPDGADPVSSATRSLLYSEKRLNGDVYQSELRSHRIGLQSLSNAWPRLLVNDANVIYCYPFAVPKADPVAWLHRQSGAVTRQSGKASHLSSLVVTRR